ncbi:MAG: hypothetical protein FVQ81_07670 [Candidatus Glassbacteria bacterium]|nr:hypothetical protein [Candidatus Glassbacteria bacterium]
MADFRLQLRWRSALLLVLAAIVTGLIYNGFGGIALVAPQDTARRALGTGLPVEDGIHLVGLDAARQFIDQAQGPVVDARSPEQYGEGHISGAVNCYVYELETYLPPLLERVALDDPMMIYCAGADCEDSRFLAQTMQELGFKRLYVYEGGFENWKQAGLAIGTGTDSTQPAATGSGVRQAADFSRYVPAWLWLAGELALLAFGVWILVLLKRGDTDSFAPGLALRVVGLVFVLASLYKIVSPAQFARIVDNYQILPPATVNFTAIVLPWLELISGLLLLAGLVRGGASLVLAGLTLVFIAAISFNLIRGVEFDCGCFGSGHTPPWRILLRDAGLLLCCLPGLRNLGTAGAQNTD